MLQCRAKRSQIFYKFGKVCMVCAVQITAALTYAKQNWLFQILENKNIHEVIVAWGP